jgi:hypothetical protein
MWRAFSVGQTIYVTVCNGTSNTGGFKVFYNIY